MAAKIAPVRRLARENPFATWRTDSLAFRFPQGGWDENMLRLAELDFRAAIVGPQGTGKSTLLRELNEALKRRHRTPILMEANAVPPDNRQWLERELSACRPDQVILVDNSERLTWWQRRRLLRSTRGRCGVVLVTHRPTSLPTWIQTSGRWETCQVLLRELGFAETNSAVFSAARRLLEMHQGDIRKVLRSLYDDPAPPDHFPPPGWTLEPRRGGLMPGFNARRFDRS